MTDARQGQFKPGDRVVLKNGAEADPKNWEKGIVIHSWVDENGDIDCYVAFFGRSWPEPGKKPEKPYVLRYFDTSLQRLDD